MKRSLLWLIPTLILVGSGCTMAPHYVRPESSVASSWPAGDAYPDSLNEAGLPAVSELKEEEFFPDSRLQQVLALATQNNLDLRLAALKVEQVRAAYKIKRGQLLPAVNATGSEYRSKIPGDVYSTGGNFTTEEYKVDFGISAWEIDLFGRLRSEKNQAFEQYLASAEGRRGAELSLVSAVGQSYLSLAASREQLALAQSTLESQRSIYELIQRQYDAGLVSKLDLRRAQMQMNAAQGDLARYTRQVAQQRNALNLLAGAPVPDELLPSGLDDIAAPPEVSAGLSSEVLLRRPDIMAAEHELKAANAFIGVARAAFFPRISLTALIGTASRSLSGLFSSGSGSWTFNPQLTTPLFDMRTPGALRASKAQRDIALTQYQKAIQTAFKEVADALAAKGTIDEQVAAQDSMVSAAQEAYQLAQDRYSKGLDSYLSVLDSQRTLYSSRQGLVALRLAKLANRVQLYAVLGGGASEEKRTNPKK